MFFFLLLDYNMVFINNPYDLTLTASNYGPAPALMASESRTSGKTFEQAMNINRIYQGNGLICQRRMCESLTGCSSAIDCPGHPDWQKVQDFCGPIQTGGISMDGSYWTLQNVDARQQALTATRSATGFSQLPTPYNVVGMY